VQRQLDSMQRSLARACGLRSDDESSQLKAEIARLEASVGRGKEELMQVQQEAKQAEQDLGE
jgi:hypothetical protein